MGADEKLMPDIFWIGTWSLCCENIGVFPFMAIILVDAHCTYYTKSRVVVKICLLIPNHKYSEPKNFFPLSQMLNTYPTNAFKHPRIMLMGFQYKPITVFSFDFFADLSIFIHHNRTKFHEDYVTLIQRSNSSSHRIILLIN